MVKLYYQFCIKLRFKIAKEYFDLHFFDDFEINEINTNPWELPPMLKEQTPSFWSEDLKMF